MRAYYEPTCALDTGDIATERTNEMNEIPPSLYSLVGGTDMMKETINKRNTAINTKNSECSDRSKHSDMTE